MEDLDIAVATAPANAFVLRSRGVFRLNGGNLQVASVDQ